MSPVANQIAKFRQWLEEYSANKDRAKVMWCTKELRKLARENLNTK